MEAFQAAVETKTQVAVEVAAEVEVVAEEAAKVAEAVAEIDETDLNLKHLISFTIKALISDSFL